MHTKHTGILRPCIDVRTIQQISLNNKFRRQNAQKIYLTISCRKYYTEQGTLLCSKKRQNMYNVTVIII